MPKELRDHLELCIARWDEEKSKIDVRELLDRIASDSLT